MLRFFNKIRKRLLDQKKLGRYASYAVGELALVIIGIFIALLLNERRELSANEERYKRIFASIHNENQNNIARINETLEKIRRNDSVCRRYLSIDWDQEDLEEYYESYGSLLSTEDLAELTNDIAANLPNQSENLPEEYEDLFSEVYRLNRILDVEIRDYEALLESILERNEEYLLDRYTWLSSWDFEMFEDSAVYTIKNDWRYRNAVNKKFLNQNYYIQELIEYLEEVLELNENLAGILGDSEIQLTVLEENKGEAFIGTYVLVDSIRRKADYISPQFSLKWKANKMRYVFQRDGEVQERIAIPLSDSLLITSIGNYLYLKSNEVGETLIYKSKFPHIKGDIIYRKE